MIAIGTRGDVQPLVSLAAGLNEAGHDVRLATHPRFESLARAHEIDFFGIAEGAVSRGAETEEGREWAEKSGKLPAWVGLLRDAKSVARQRLADCRDACDEAEAIVVSLLGTLIGYQLAAHTRVPLVRAYYAPFGPAADFRPTASVPERLGAGLDRLRHGVAR